MDEPISRSRIIEFRALGTAELKGPEGNDLLSVLARPKLLALLSYLAASAGRGFVRRDTLINLFWGEVDLDRARNSLRQSLHHLRRSLGEDVLVGRGDDEVGLAEAGFWCDVAAFEDALTEGRREEALELYRGDMLEGFFVAEAPEFERWLEGRRAELRGNAAAASWELAEAAESAQDTTKAGGWARRALELSPLDEDLLQRVISLLDRVGDRSRAVLEYEAFTRRLQAELDLEPAPETKALIKAVRGRTVPNGRRPSEEVESAAPASSKASPVGATPAPSAGRRWGFRLGLLAGSAIVIGLGVIWTFYSIGGSEDTELDSRRVLITAFDNQTGDPDLDPVGRMAADWIMQGIQGTGLLEAVPPQATLHLVSGEAGEREHTLAEQTGAGTIISGTVYLFEDSLQLQAHVSDVQNQKILVSVKSDRSSRGDPGPAVESLRQRVVGALAITHDRRIAVYANVALQPPTFEAYRAFTEGEELYNRAFAPGNGHLREASLRLLLRAFELDSTLRAAQLRAADAMSMLGDPAGADSVARIVAEHRDELSPFARAELDKLLASLAGDRMRALEAARRQPHTPLDPALAALWANRPRETVETLENAEWYARALRSGRYYGIEQMYWQLLAAGYHMLGEHERELKAARVGRDAYPDVLALLQSEVWALAALGRVEELYDRLDESLTLPPQEGVSPGYIMTSAALELRAHGDPEEARATAERAIGWYRSLPSEAKATPAFRVDLAGAYYVVERWDQARAIFEELATAAPGDLNYQGFLGVLAARRGDTDEALRISEELNGMAEPYDHGREPYWQACIAAQLGDTERAIVLLREAYAQGLPFDLRLHMDPDLEPLHDSAPFQEFLAPKG
jgi:DNA-binding SARP family transcriptional activator